MAGAIPHRWRTVAAGCLAIAAACSAAPGPMLRRFLDGPMRGVEEIVFAVRVPGRDHWYANFGTYCNAPERRAYGDGGRLCALDLRTGRVRVLLDDPKGGVRDPQVHYGGERILLSYRKGGTPTYHLYEVRTDSSGLRQLTDGPDDDIEPAYLPDGGSPPLGGELGSLPVTGKLQPPASGGIVFVSSRCHRTVPCWYTRVGILYRCDGDGGHIRPLSSNAEHENTPWVLSDGRLLYMRWEYVDRNQLLFHHLWTVNPDGTGVMVYFGNQYPGYVMIDAKPVPGSHKIVASFSPGHGRPEHMGTITLVDPRSGPDHMGSTHRVAKGFYRDPYPFSEDCFLVADERGIQVMDGQGRTELVYALPRGEARLQCHEPRPIRPRPREPVIPSRVRLSSPTGRLFLTDVHTGRNMGGVRRGEIRSLLVLEQLPKPVNFSGGQEPLTIGGTFCLERVLGTVAVEPDGSAWFEAPALRSLFFVALDDRDLSVKRMQSFVTLMPGETTGCVGCHESRGAVPHERPQALALKRPPSRIEPIPDVAGRSGPSQFARTGKLQPLAASGPDVLDFPRDVQPILDRHCVRCHNPDRPDGGVDLCGDHTPAYAVGYWTLLKRGLISDGRNTRRSNLPPRAVGSSASRLLKLADGSHYDAKPSPRERRILRLWIESGAVYPGTYAALGCGIYPVKFPVKAMERRCGPCHGSSPKQRHATEKGMTFFQFGKAGPPQPLLSEISMRHITLVRRLAYYQLGEAGPHQSLCNLTRPAKSLLVRAPLATAAGGLGRCTPQVFANAADPDYKAILAAVADAARRLREGKRFDLPGFRPNPHYIREMQRYGILAKDLDPTEPIDYYAVDRAYWRSFWHKP